MTDEEILQAAAKLLAKNILEHLACSPESISSLTVERLYDPDLFQFRAEYRLPMLPYIQLSFPVPSILPTAVS